MNNAEWLAIIMLIGGCAGFVLWIILLIADAREKLNAEESREYEIYACAQCGSYTVWRTVGWAICDSCGMKVELD